MYQNFEANVNSELFRYRMSDAEGIKGRKKNLGSKS